MACGVKTDWAKVSCLRLLVGVFNVLLGVSWWRLVPGPLIRFDHLYRQSHLTGMLRFPPHFNEDSPNSSEIFELARRYDVKLTN